MNIYLTKDFMETEEVREAHYLFLEDVESFRDECSKHLILTTGIIDEGIYYWNYQGRWEKIEEEDIPFFKEASKMEYKDMPNLYIFRNGSYLAIENVDNSDNPEIVYKIINTGIKKTRGFFKKNPNGLWRRKMTPEEISKLFKINEDLRGKILRKRINYKYEQ